MTIYWQEPSRAPAATAGDAVDMAFALTCRTLPVDHAYPLLEALIRVLPWLADDADSGVHPIHGAESGNGWTRPEDPRALLHLSRRTKLILRLPPSRVPGARALTGRRLDLADHTLDIGADMVRPLHPIATMFSRHVVITANDDETGFLGDCARQLRALGVMPKKMLCGRETRITIPGGSLRTRSLMLADLTAAESMTLQRCGLGPARTLGCGLFVGHKDVNAVKQETD